MLINAMLKRPYPPISLPARQYMENAKVIWESWGPPLKPKCRGMAIRSASGLGNSSSKPIGRCGGMLKTGEELVQKRRNDKRLNDLYLSL
jgi:hypothetical protein